MNKSKIEWCEYTFNPVTGCFHNCEYCYADKIARRVGKNYKAYDEIMELEKPDKEYPYVF